MVIAFGAIFAWNVIFPQGPPLRDLTVAHASLHEDEDGGGIEIENGDSFPWERIVLRLNDSYVYEPPKALPPHEFTWYFFGDFTDASNHRFDVKTTKPRTITIEADTPNGRGRYGGSWKNR